MAEHYFSEKPESGFKSERFNIRILGNDIIINSGSGIFSLKKVDVGTRLLIENAIIPKKDCAVLDLGCGYGIIGIAIKKAHPNAEVTISDVNERALKLARQNCIENDAEADIVKSNIFSGLKEKKFDIILTNPPFSAGKELCREFIMQSHEHLNDNGLLELVAPHNKGGKSLREIMLETFGNAEDIAKKAGFRVYKSRKG